MTLILSWNESLHQTRHATVLLAVQAGLRVTGDYSARMTVHPATEIFRRPDPVLTGHYVPWDEQRIYGYRPVDGVILGSVGRDEVNSSWLEIVTDAVHQAGAACSLNPDQVSTMLWAGD